MPASIRHALLLHGAGGGGWEWNIWRGVFAAGGIEPVAPDLQPAAAGLAATTFEDYLQQARAALAALPRPRAVIGASLGGLLAMALPDAADALVLMNPLPPSPWCSAVACARLAGRCALATRCAAGVDAARDAGCRMTRPRCSRSAIGAMNPAPCCVRRITGSTCATTGMPGAVRGVDAGRGRAAGVDACAGQ